MKKYISHYKLWSVLIHDPIYQNKKLAREMCHVSLTALMEPLDDQVMEPSHDHLMRPPNDRLNGATW